MIDLRSDTVTRPTAAMRDAMMRAPLGDDVLGDEPTVAELERTIAERLGKAAAVFVPSGTMANQLAIRSACEPGDEIVAHRDSHVIHYETGAPAALSGCMVAPLDGDGGVFRAADVDAAIRPKDHHAPRSRMLVLENTHNRGGGTVWPADAFRECARAGTRHGLHVHLDGARLFNAAVASGVDARSFADEVDSVSVCFSKGLGAPVGSALSGSADFIARAKRFRKMFGGAMRQSGLLAAACLYALAHHVDRLREDHENARRLAAGLVGVPAIRLECAPDAVPTNMVFFRVADAKRFCGALLSRGVAMIPMGADRVRAVTHLDVDRSAIDDAIGRVRDAAR